MIPSTTHRIAPLASTLRYRSDLQSLFYLAVQPLLMAWQWRYGFNLPVYLLSLFLAVGISVIHHNHAHLPMWRRRWLNRGTDLYITLLQGHPTFVFHPAHNRNHHRYRHGPRDAARTWRFGDSNDLLGWVLHPLQAVLVIYPLIITWLQGVARRAPAVLRWYLLQYAVWLGSWAVLLLANPGKAIVLVIVPQLFGLHWLLAANYLQHAHADDQSRFGYARNFEGAVNPLLFNIGLHTAHHEHARAHWSQLPSLHRQYRDMVDPRLLESSLIRYAMRTFVLGAFSARFRSHSLRAVHGEALSLEDY